MGISEIYTDEVHSHLHPWYANWEPGEPINIGDYGRMDGDIFIREGHISTFLPDFLLETVRDRTADHKKFSSEGVQEVAIGADGRGNVGGAADVSAGLRLEFSRKKGVFFNAAECTTVSLKDKTGLGKEIMKLYRNDTWKKKWVIVTDLVKAKATTVAVSASKNSSITIQAKGDAAEFDLADASIDLKFTNSGSVGYTVEAEKGLIPLIKLSGISTTPWNPFDDDEFRPMRAVQPGIGTLTVTSRKKKGPELVFTERW